MPHRNYITHRYKRVVALLTLLAAPALAQAANLRVAWDPSADSNIAGYKLAYGTTSGQYSQSLNAGNSTSATVTSLTPGATYYFVVKAYNSIGLESMPSNEIALTMPNNVPPTVTLTSPQANASLNGTTPISLTATASDSDGTIVKVEFYQDTTKIGESTASPYAATWNNAPSGNFTLTALAYDDSGAAVRSAGVPVAVSGSPSAPGGSPTPGLVNKIRPMALTPIIRAGDIAQFKLVNTQVDPSQPTVVNYAIGGNATAGVDYVAPNAVGQITIPAGARGISMPLQTMSSTNGTRKTVVLTVLPGNGYAPGRATAVVRVIGH